MSGVSDLEFAEQLDKCRNKGIAVALGFLKGLGSNPTDAEDLVQEAMYYAFLKRESFRGEAKLKTWFLRILINCSISFLREKWNNPKIRFSIDDFGKVMDPNEASVQDLEDERLIPGMSVEPTQEEDLLTQETYDVLNLALKSLKRERRAAVILRYQGELSFKEIGDIVGAKEGTVRSRFFRGKEDAKKIVEKYLTKGAGA